MVTATIPTLVINIYPVWLSEGGRVYRHCYWLRLMVIVNSATYLMTLSVQFVDNP